jgi:hypothetical protein
MQLSHDLFNWLDGQGWYSKCEAPLDWDYDNWCHDTLIVVTFRDPSKAILFKLTWHQYLKTGQHRR